MTIRITAIPRTGSPQSGYHPHFFASRHDDIVWVLPGKGKCLSSYSKLVFFWFESIGFIANSPDNIVKIFSLFTVFARALFIRKQVIIVHSFVFAFPIWLAGQQFAIVVHGSDHKHLQKAWGKFIASRANKIFGVGFSTENKRFNVSEVPNIFSLPPEHVVGDYIEYDVVFVLRNALVKNPKFPDELFFNIPKNLKIKIAVIGVSSKDSTTAASSAHSEPQKEDRCIDYFGLVPHSQVISIMQKSKLLIIPSHSEGVAKAMLEALSCGLRVVINANINLPDVFSQVVEKVNIYDWEKMQDILMAPFDPEISNSNVVFAKEYRDNSILELEAIYSEVSVLQ